MSYKWLKWTRVLIALIFFLFTTLIFIDFRGIISEDRITRILWLQFTPSLLKFITLFSLSAAGFIIILVLTSLFGRVYCASVCPLGIFQDFIIRAGKLLKVRKRFRYRKPAFILRNTILVVIILSAFTGSIILVNIFDPYSLYGKFANGLLRPVAIGINNILTGALEARGHYYLYHVDILPFSFITLIIPVLTLLTLIIMAGKFGRLFCNTICPVGTILGWVSKKALFRISFDTGKCTKCGKCSFACKSECMNIKDLTVDYSRCVACFNCLTVCEDAAIDYRITWSRKNNSSKNGHDPGKRAFLATSLGGIAVLAGIKESLAAGKDITPLNKRPTEIPEIKNYPVSPPGSLSIGHFTSLCTACQLCVGQCPTGVLQPSLNQYGWSGYMQPFMDFDTNYCNYDCVKCSNVCPTGAILSITEEAKRSTQIGKVVLEIKNCVVYTENTACGSCSEHCPTQAVRMVPYINNLTIPEVDETICVGCGACEYACPVHPFKAIYVDGNPVHEIAKSPAGDSLEYTETEDFPF